MTAVRPFGDVDPKASVIVALLSVAAFVALVIASVIVYLLTSGDE